MKCNSKMWMIFLAGLLPVGVSAQPSGAPLLTINPETARVAVTQELGLVAYVEEPGEQLTPPAPNPSDYQDEGLLAAPPAKSPNGGSAAEGTNNDELNAPPWCVWKVNGAVSGNPTWGTLRPVGSDGRMAIYQAPPKVPPRNPVAVSCEVTRETNGKRVKVIAVSYITVTDKSKTWAVTVSYHYDESDQTSTQGVTNYHTEARDFAGGVVLRPGPSGLTPATSQGHFTETVAGGTKNAMCHSEYTQTLAGDLTLEIQAVNQGANGMLAVNAGSQVLQGSQHRSQSCGQSRPAPDATWNNGGFAFSCTISGIDFARSGHYSAPVSADQGHGTCKVSIVPR